MKSWESWQKERKEKNPLPPVIVIGGDERSLVDDAIAQLKSIILSGGLADFNYDRCDGKVESFSSILDKANTAPVFSDKRLVEVRGLDSGKLDDDALEQYLERPYESTVLLLIFDTFDQRHKGLKNLLTKAQVYNFSHFSDVQKIQFAQDYAKAIKLNIDKEGIHLLIELSGDDLGLIKQSLDKLLVASDGKASAQDVSAHIASTRLEDAFLLGRAIALSDRALALKSLLSLEQDREAPLRLVGLIAWQLRQIIKAKVLLDDGQSPLQVAKTLSLYGDRQRLVIQAAQKWPAQTLISRLTRLADLDKALKSSRAPDWLWMTRVILQMCPLKT